MVLSDGLVTHLPGWNTMRSTHLKGMKLTFDRQWQRRTSGGGLLSDLVPAPIDLAPLLEGITHRMDFWDLTW